MSHNHSTTHPHNNKTSNHNINTKITLSAQEQALNSASQTTKSQPQLQDPKIESKSHLGITIQRWARAVARDPVKITFSDLGGRCWGC
jgi:hypothetical protein